jgi:hypothetical protein
VASLRLTIPGPRQPDAITGGWLQGILRLSEAQCLQSFAGVCVRSAPQMLHAERRSPADFLLSEVVCVCRRVVESCSHPIEEDFPAVLGGVVFLRPQVPALLEEHLCAPVAEVVEGPYGGGFALASYGRTSPSASDETLALVRTDADGRNPHRVASLAAPLEIPRDSSHVVSLGDVATVMTPGGLVAIAFYRSDDARPDLVLASVLHG